MSQRDLGELLATDDEVPMLKPRSKAAQARAADPVAAVVPEYLTPEQRVKAEPRIRIVLEENENIPPTGQFISADGVAFILRPGEAADVPMSVVRILDDAIQAVPQIDPSTKQVVGYRNKKRFPYSVVREAA